MRFLATSLLLLPAALGLNINRNAPLAKRQETTGRYLVRAAPGASLPVLRTAVEDILSQSRRAGPPPEIEDEFSLNGLEGVVIDASEADAEAIEALGQVALVEEDIIVELDQFSEEVVEEFFEEDAETEFTEGVTTQSDVVWGLARTSSRPPPNDTQFYFEQSAGRGSTVYVVDTGVYLEHNEFGGRASHGFTAFPEEGFGDLNGHGTHVASTAAGAVYGVAKNAEIINVKVLSGEGRGSAAGIIAGNEWIINHAAANGRSGRATVNYSLGFRRPPGTSQILDDSFRAVAAAGLMVVASAGNANTNTLNQSPGGVAESCTIGATSRNDSRAWFSSFGDLVDVHAPGVAVTAAAITGPDAVRTISGTSMAAPHVAGVGAYLLTLEGPRSAQALCDRIVGLSTRDILTMPAGYPVESFEALDQTPNRLLYNGVSELVFEPGFQPIVSLGDAAINAPLRNCADEATLIGGRIYTEGIFNINRCATHCRETSEFEASQGRSTRCRFFNTWVQNRNGVPEAQHCALYTQAWESSLATNTGQFQGGDVISISQSYTVTVEGDDGVPACQ